MNELPEGASAARVTSESVWKRYVERCSHQDASAVGRLYDKSSSLIYSLVRRILGDEADAEEVTLDTYTQICRVAPSYDPSRGNVTAWIVTIAGQIDEPMRELAEFPPVIPPRGRDHSEPETAANQRRVGCLAARPEAGA
jgi:hypothetical protein